MRAIDGDALKKKLRDAINMGMSINTSGLAELNAVLSDVETMPTIEPERKWIPCSEPPDNAENVFIAHGSNNFMTCCIGHYGHDSGLWYEDRNWFARPIYDGMYWCEMPMLPEAEG